MKVRPPRACELLSDSAVSSKQEATVIRETLRNLARRGIPGAVLKHRNQEPIYNWLYTTLREVWSDAQMYLRSVVFALCLSAPWPRRY